MDIASDFQTLAISLGLGLLVGTQRERVNSSVAGVRTFALITLLGTLSGMLARDFGPWVVAAGLLGVSAATVVGNVLSLKSGRADSGITTEIAILLMYGIGAYLVTGNRSLAVVLGGSIAVLLYSKPVLHGAVQRLGETDMRVMMQFVLITLVILPVLPNQTYGPFDVVNPREVWTMVVLVVGISLLGYIALKLYGEHAGVLIAGLVGGLVSSTATTVSYARRAGRENLQLAIPTIIVLLATSVVYARVLTEVAVVAPSIFSRVVTPIAIVLAVSAAISFLLWSKLRKERIELATPENPTELRSAILFALIYAIVQVGVAAARHSLGDRGVYAAAAVSGLTDMDAITLSTSKLGAQGLLDVSVVWRSILCAAISNLFFKASVVAALGGAALGRRVALLFGIQVLVALILLFAWPS
jgi:uncharacterized membrane protein (DUF4010 family)